MKENIFKRSVSLKINFSLILFIKIRPLLDAQTFFPFLLPSSLWEYQISLWKTFLYSFYITSSILLKTSRLVV